MTVNIAGVLKKGRNQADSRARRVSRCFAHETAIDSKPSEKLKSLSIILKPGGTLRASQLRLDTKRVGIDWLVKVELSQLSYPISRKGSALRIDG